MGIAQWTVRPVEHSDWPAWCSLFQGYAEFYERPPLSDDHLRRVWSWIHDEGRMWALVAVPVEGGPAIGLAHLREWIRPLRGIVCGYLDDLFVDRSVRGGGAVGALFAAIDSLAHERKWEVVRWTTADDNYRARAVYDQLAARTTWITYDMTPRPKEPAS
jgi:RimJ/RimL family protein N-acetyltransferase